MSAPAGMVDPADLTATEKEALRRIDRLQLRRRKGGYGVRGEYWKVTLRTVAELERLGLVRRVIGGGRNTVMITGSGKMTLAVLEERVRRARGALSREEPAARRAAI